MDQELKDWLITMINGIELYIHKKDLYAIAIKLRWIKKVIETDQVISHEQKDIKQLMKNMNDSHKEIDEEEICEFYEDKIKELK